MTNEEAIAIITEAIEDYVCNHVTDTAQAQRMLNAVQALEQEPRYCDRNICLKNEYSNIGCDECEVTKSQESYDFAKWVAKEIFDEWEYNKDSFAEIACRKLAKLGIVRAKGDEWELVEPQEGAVRNDI